MAATNAVAAEQKQDEISASAKGDGSVTEDQKRFPLLLRDQGEFQIARYAAKNLVVVAGTRCLQEAG